VAGSVQDLDSGFWPGLDRVGRVLFKKKNQNDIVLVKKQKKNKRDLVSQVTPGFQTTHPPIMA
jgi:hypothetical protein